jgi:UDP-N-acetylmuramate dehydrogenase
MDLPQVKGKLARDYPLKKLNTWRTGGLGELVFWPKDINELVKVVTWWKNQNNEKPLLLLGCGSNVLLPDEGFKGLIIVLTQLKKIFWEEDMVSCEAGHSLRRLTTEAASRGLGGLEFACGIPGTVGAAIAINAGAHGEEIGKLVKTVKVLTPEGEIRILPREDICFEYRRSSLLEKGYFVLESTIGLNPGEKSTVICKKMNDLLAKRRITQPLEYPNAGSVFRNPPGNSAGRLIEQAGWKGRSIGDAQVSEKHANFIVNRGNAKSEEILRLILEIQKDINIKFGIELETEIRVITG